MDLADILSTPPTGLPPGTSPKRPFRRSHSPPPATTSAAATTTPPANNPNAGPVRTPYGTLTPPYMHLSNADVQPLQLYPQVSDNHSGRIPGDQILHSLSHFHESDFDTSEPDFDAPPEQPSDDAAASAAVFGYFFGDDDIDRSEPPSDNDPDPDLWGGDMDDIDFIDLGDATSSETRLPPEANDSQNSYGQAHTQNSAHSFHTAPAGTAASTARKRPRPVSRSSTSRPTTSTGASHHHSIRSPRAKRARQLHDASRPAAADIPSVNLIDDDEDDAPNASDPAESASARLLSASIALQQAGPDPASAATKLTASTCSICMSAPREAIATVCGHLFCRACLTQWLGHATRRARKRATCPSCRAGISVPSAGPRGGSTTRNPTVVNLEFKRKRAAPTAAG